MTPDRAKRPAAVPARDAWYRSSEWDERARVEFEVRCARARPSNRIQYRRIKAGALLQSGDPRRQEGGRTLLEQILTDPAASPYEKVGALCFLGAHEQEIGRLDDAERHLRAAIEFDVPTMSGRTDLEEVRLAEVLLARGGRSRLEEARTVLEKAEAPTFLSSRFRLFVVGVKVSMALHDTERARMWATAALAIIDAGHSGLANHPTLGLVRTDSETRSWLAAIAAGRMVPFAE